MTTTPGRLRPFAMCIAATVASMGLAATAQQADRVITLRFPADVPPGLCTVTASVQTSPARTGGSFPGAPQAGGMFTFVPAPGFDGSVAVRGVVECPGRGLGLIDLPADSKDWTADVPVPRLETIVVRGQVQPGVLPLTGLSVGIYSGGEKEGWKNCTWLLNPPAHGGIDCLTFLTGPHLASGLLDADGRFEARLPISRRTRRSRVAI